MTHLTKLAILESLKRALAGTYFNLCGIEHAARVLGKSVYTGSPDWHTLQALHCVHWTAFDAKAKVELVYTIGRVLGLDAPEDGLILVDGIHLIPSEV